MKNLFKYIQLLSAVTIIPCIWSLPTEEEQQKIGKNLLPPLMRTLLSDIAKELMTRSSPNSQVLTMNVTNLLILLLLKGLIWGASYVGGAAGHQKARINDSVEPLITETEILLLLSYLMGENDKNFDCLHRVACEDANKTKEYMNIGKMVINTAKFMGVASVDSKKYENVLSQLQQVLKFKENGGNCETKYSCTRGNENRI